jgi:hypothetical protein
MGESLLLLQSSFAFPVVEILTLNFSSPVSTTNVGPGPKNRGAHGKRT